MEMEMDLADLYMAIGVWLTLELAVHGIDHAIEHHGWCGTDGETGVHSTCRYMPYSLRALGLVECVAVHGIVHAYRYLHVELVLAMLLRLQGYSLARCSRVQRVECGYSLR